MTRRIVTFIRLLRTQGLPVSVAESLDALHSVSQVGVHDRDLLRFTLRTALVQSHQDIPTLCAPFRALLPGAAPPRAWAGPAASQHEHGCWPTPGTAAEWHPLHTCTAHTSDASSISASSCPGIPQ